MTQQLASATRIKRIFEQIRGHHKSGYKKIADVRKSLGVMKKEWRVNGILDSFTEPLETFEKKSESLNNKINRSETKIFLFGNVSVGKTKLLNCVLRSDLFVSAMGQTTSCFVHVMKSPHSRYVIKYNSKEETFDDIDRLKERIVQLGTSHDIENNENLGVDESLEFYLPIKNNKILKEGTHIIDCPGAGDQELITNAIVKHSEDADIFIFVMSHSLTDDDKKFFKIQSKVSCLPDVYIVVNKSDECDQDEETATKASKKSIVKQCSDFLKDECRMDCSDIKNRIFFISAREVFLLQVKRDPNVKMTDKVKERCQSFDNFENILKQSIANLQQNKTRRYQSEIDQVNKGINLICAELRRKILDLKTLSETMNHENLTHFKNSLAEIFIKFKSQLKKQIKANIDSIASENYLDSSVLNTNIMLLGTELSKDMNWFTKEQEMKVDRCIMDNLSMSGDSKNKTKDRQIRKTSFEIENQAYSIDKFRKPNDAQTKQIEEFSNVAFSFAKDSIYKGFDLLAKTVDSPQNLPISNFSHSLTRRRSFSNFGGVNFKETWTETNVFQGNPNQSISETLGWIAVTAAGCALVGTALSLYNEHRESEALKEHTKVKEKLKKIETEIVTKCTNYLDEVKGQFDTKIQSIIDLIDKHNQVTEEYWTGMERVLSPWQEDP